MDRQPKSLLAEVLAGFAARGWDAADLARYRMLGDPITLPENLTDLTDDELTALADSISERAENLNTDTLTDDAIAEVEALAEAADAVAGETQRRADVQAAQRVRMDEALARLNGPGETPAEGVDASGEEGELGEGEETPEQVAAAALPAGVVTEPPVRATVPATARREGSLANLRRPASATPRRGGSHAFMMSDKGSPLSDVKALAEAITRRRLAMGNVPDNVHGDCQMVATGAKTFSEDSVPLTSADPERNYSVLRDAANPSRLKALVASGSSCAPFTPMYEIYRLAEPQSPIEDAIPSVQAPRGGVRYIKAPDYTQALGTVGVATLPKPHAAVSCPSIQDQAVEAVTQIVQFDNLQYRVFAEQVEGFLEDVAVIFAQRKEVVYLTAIDGVSTPVSSAIPYGASRGLIYDWLTASTAFRKRHGMKRGTPLEIMLPDWSLDLVKLDMSQDGNLGLDYMGIPDAKVNSILDEIGLIPVWYNDAATGLGGGTADSQKFDQAQAAGNMNPWPVQVVSYIHGVGSNVRLDGGTLDVGIVRDSTLNGTNDLQIFMEEWVGIIELAPEQIKLVSTVCPNGSRPTQVTAFTCPAA